MFRAISLLVLLAALHGAPVAAQVTCGEYDNWVRTLDSKYGESRRSSGISVQTVFETWANEKTGTWTIISVYPNGRACVVASGESWQEYKPRIPGTNL